MAVKRRRRVPIPVQRGLFDSKPLSSEKAALIRRLEEAAKVAPIGGRRLSGSALRRLMTPLPPITVPK